jgi:hypothetical protein
VIAVHIPEREFDDFYNGCCNGTFWPLFHSMPDRAVFKAHTWDVRIWNKIFAGTNLSHPMTHVCHMKFKVDFIMSTFLWRFPPVY